jgi:hypothetical protein
MFAHYGNYLPFVNKFIPFIGNVDLLLWLVSSQFGVVVIGLALYRGLTTASRAVYPLFAGSCG